MVDRSVLVYWVQEAVDRATQHHQETNTETELNLSLFSLGLSLIKRATQHNTSATEIVRWGFDEMDGVWGILEKEADHADR